MRFCLQESWQPTAKCLLHLRTIAWRDTVYPFNINVHSNLLVPLLCPLLLQQPGTKLSSCLTMLPKPFATL